MAAKNISVTGSGAVVLKETALSSAAMSDLSGDINDTSSTLIPTTPVVAPAENNAAASSAINNTLVGVGAN